MPVCNSLGCDRHPSVEQVLGGEQWPPELEVALRDLLEQMADAGHEVTLHNLGRFLGDFVPRYTLDRAEEWQERATRRWVLQTKPALVDKLADVFIGAQ
ncbi:hypothetical protein CRX42_04565 [Pseudomonas jessenii]|uniref:Uncharacterized protein n=1 Tax=Pseudomonas jessenii TaxID=77298 RepID=A0A2W0ETJ9_PSEJE|nr:MULTISPECIES: hypothetical protein [Pseudomonas]PYY71743.1 hypothetical protein CRX42_04565 [Pseudomonas jessenii]WPN32624.1 hypothetical protein QMK54_13140 [Pseudomonas sp. P5_109]